MTDRPGNLPANDKPSFFAELKQRHVVRAGIIYIAAAWAIAQGIAQLGPTFGVSTMVTWWFVIACAIGFPFWIAFAWYFKITAHGVAREDGEVEDRATARRTRRRFDYWIIGILVIAVVLLLTNELILQRGKTIREFAATAAPAATTTIPAHSIAVLPFENLSADKNNEYFVAGIQDLILTKLADVGGLKVIARTSTAMYASHPENLTQIGAQLGVATILEGSVQRAGNEVLINVQLINTKTDAHVWAKAYTRTLTNVFGVEGEVAEKIAVALKATLSPVEAANVHAVPTTNPTAYNVFLRAEYQLNQGLVSNDPLLIKPALLLYRKAVAADPGFALAWARLSYAESFAAWFGGGGLNVPKLQAAAHQDASRAQKLAPDAAATQLALGYAAYYGESNYAAALKAFREALTQRPNDSEAMAAIGNVLRRQHRYAPAIAEYKRALALDPRNAHLSFVLANTYGIIRRYNQSLAPYRRAIALDPGNTVYRDLYSTAIVYGSGNLKHAWAAAQGDAPELEFVRIQILTWQRQYDAAIALLQTIPDTSNNFPVGTEPKGQQLADLYQLAGDRMRAKPLYTKALEISQAQLKAQAGNALNLAYVWWNLADAELGLGNRRAAFAATAKSLTLASRLKAFESKQEIQLLAATLYAQAKRADLALPLLARLLVAPNGGETIAPVLLRLNPAWDQIRHDPGFQALLKKYPAPAPATAVISVSAD